MSRKYLKFLRQYIVGVGRYDIYMSQSPKEKIMEYIILLLLMILVGVILSQKLPQIYQVWVNCYWVILETEIAYQIAFVPYRMHRILHNLSQIFN